MIDPQKVTKFSGPPGTGKSTTLLNVVETLLTSGVDPEQIVYTTFSRAGAYEARDRACARFKLSANRLPYFRTLHSLCYQLLPSTEIMGPKDWNFLGRELHLYFSSSGTWMEEGGLRFQTKGDVLMALWSLGRLTLKPIEQIWAKRADYKGPEIQFAELVRFIDACTSYKNAHGKMDYTDMLEKWLISPGQMNCDYVIIDEAQDLSALQWQVVDKLCTTAKKVWVAGDDDQCIHEWNGASPQHFIELGADNYEVLPQSYRIPSRVHKVAQDVIGRVKNRLPKQYKPREEEGIVQRIHSLEDVSLRTGSWLLLAYNQYLLDIYVKHCRECGLYFTGGTADSAEVVKAIDQIKTWNDLRSLGSKVRCDRLKKLYPAMSQVKQVARGFKTKLLGERDDRMLGYEDLVADFGLVTARETEWPDALDLIQGEIAHYLKIVDPKGLFAEAPRIRISTIHGAKGKEADHVVLMTDLSQRTYDTYVKHPDPEHRVFYVGVTRAKKSLHIMHPSSDKAYAL